MIPFRHVTSGPPTVTPPRRPTATVTPPALHHCPVCDCEGTATTCWCCGTTTGERK